MLPFGALTLIIALSTLLICILSGHYLLRWYAMSLLAFKDFVPVIGLYLSQCLRNPLTWIMGVWYSYLDIRTPKKEAFLTNPARSQDKNFIRVGRTAHTDRRYYGVAELLRFTDASRFVT